MKVIPKPIVLDSIQLTRENYEEFRKFVVEEKGWRLSELHKSSVTGRIWVYLTETTEPIYINEGDYIIFNELSILIEVVPEDQFKKKYEVIPEEV